MERCWETRVELVSALKEGAVSSSMAPHVLKRSKSRASLWWMWRGVSPVGLKIRLPRSHMRVRQV